MKNLIKILIIIFSIAIILFASYSFLNRGASEDVGFEKTSGTTVSSNLSYLSKLQKIELDIGFYQDETFVNLVDWSRPLDPEPVGRSNPFAAF